MAGTTNAPKRGGAATLPRLVCAFIKKGFSPLFTCAESSDADMARAGGRQPNVKLFLNWFYCAHKYSMPISAVATEDSVAPTICARDPGGVTSEGSPTGPEHGKTAHAD